MATLASEELRADYSHVVSGSAVREAQRLLDMARAGRDHSVVWICLEHERASILNLEGLGREIWRGVDPKDYVNQLRGEWDAP